MSNSDLCLSFLLIAALGMQVALAKEGFKCRNATLDCDPNECCAGASPKALGVCQPQPQLSQRCSPKISPGAKLCPCATGTTCAVSHKYTRKVILLKKFELNVKYYYQCIAVPTLSPDEMEEI